MKKEKNLPKRREAIALSYDAQKNGAPKIVAKGKGIVADNIIQRAKEGNVPIQEDTSLVELLSQLQINESIPEELYQAVAEVFAFVYRMDQQQKSTHEE
ncbi:flagellar biosynthesis protein [Bacillus mesophilus]|uniref:EscU/YscU/HrcU family type III secretion system export apparatus switch protein n=1 Tax=Bacillus mesophilus TaxID=1808955 RepID=A0A6M0Q1P5_9BACI|nr:EscU/YscU/HrcU family type III secretion system export apparatus switch protein [Bacillus mesophilus]MBM7659379.1 flagellar biosynthesis protein [Bacillus mesophilus]NEY70251.1 EscU/YscU/HrcU family type III secretion system export apparatus switch protein [Bacillus mesophilus]